LHKEAEIPVGMSDLQKYMDKKWKIVEEKHKYATHVFMLGDMVEGADEKSKGLSCWTTDLDTQALNVVELFYAFEDAVFYGVEGSRYHSQHNPSQDKKVLDELGGYFQHKDYEVTVGGIKFHLRHFSGYTKNKKTRATSLGEDLTKAEMYSHIYGDIDVFLRAHCHYFTYFGLACPDRLGIVCPGFKGRDVFVAHRGLDVPDCGYLVFNVVDGQYTWSYDVWQLPKNMLIATAPVIPKEDKTARRNRIEQLRNRVETKKLEELSENI
jgi:hypothetical protein